MQDMTPGDWLAPLRTRDLVPEGALAGFVVGSAARGWHNARSDFDIYVITTARWESSTSTPTPVPVDPPSVHSETFFDQDKRWEVTYWLDSQIDQMLAKVSWDAYEAGMVAEDALSWREELTLARLGNCLPLWGEDWITESRKRLTESAFRSVMVVRSLGKADDAVEDALGQMESGDLECATISARTAFGHAVDALLEGAGEYGSHMPKWRPKRLRAATQDVLPFDTYWAVETMQGCDPADPRPWITRVLTVCQDIAMRVETT